jgi:tetratricopeptide (TPR) repeat protein
MVEAREDLAVLLARAGRPAEAEAQLRAAIARSPGSMRAHMQLGAVLGGQGRFGESVAVYQEAVRLAPRSVDAYAALADGQAKAGDFDQAITAAERARVLARDEGRGPTVAEIDRRIASYRDGRLAQPPAD